MVNDKRRTVSAPAEIGGTGLHTGASVSVRILPANDARGIRFRRTDVEGGTEIPASSEYVSDLRRRTVLGSGEAAIQTVEHLLAALSACDIDDATVEVTGPELPIGDGSTRLFFDAIREAGVLEQDTEPHTYRIESPMVVIEGESRYFLAPATQTRLTVTIEWDHPLIGRQSGCYDLSQETFDRELADARTFGFSEEAELLEEEGMAKGASPETALVLDATGLMEGDLRAPDEFVRHKTVDLIGDLKLLGGRFVGEVTAFRPSHRGNLSLVRAIKRAGRLTPPAMDISQILSVIPHRYPMLLVDRIIEVQGDERIIGIKNVTINEPFFAGHFPDHPIMPGVLIIEAMAQAGGMLLMGSVPDPESKVVYFMSIDKVKFRKPVVPGDQLRLELGMVQRRGKTCRMRGEARVADQVVAEAEMTATVVDK